MTMTTSYPVSFDVEYPDRPLNRLSTAFRILWIIPIAVVLSLLSGGAFGSGGGAGGTVVISTAGVTTLPLVLMLLFRRKYPRWWFDWNLELSRFSARVTSYLLLLRDEYPSSDEEQAVHLAIDYPDAERDLKRWMPLVKWLLAIPHYIVLLALVIIGFILVVIAWFAILFTGRYPRGMFDFVVGTLRWGYRVQAYMLLLTTDRYPPFSLK
jgi:hypothetical protein